MEIETLVRVMDPALLIPALLLGYWLRRWWFAAPVAGFLLAGAYTWLLYWVTGRFEGEDAIVEPRWVMAGVLFALPACTAYSSVAPVTSGARYGRLLAESDFQLIFV